MGNKLDLSNVPHKAIRPLGKNFSGQTPDGEKLGFTNYYMTVNDKPFFGISGEIHFARIAEEEWEDTLIKAKMGGLNIVATYVFWNVHEEVEGTFRWDGVRNIRKFLELCKKHGLYVILRVGPFGHGEMRNGALPDWLYGKPFEVRSRSEGFYDCVRRYFKAVHEQVDGMYYKQGGPVVATQLDNEYMHSAAPWEMTTGTSFEWVPGGNGGDEYMVDIKNIMKEVGLDTPFYTCTAWGGARTPIDEALPLWGGYSYQPWIFTDGRGEHPATPEYIYRDNHNNNVCATYNFEPRYDPEDRPYACCEMMGGMLCTYNYRFILPFESVDALANIKLGSGCNLLGYYMYRGGTDPVGEKTPFLNQYEDPQLNYDYQAALGQYGQVRPSWHRLRVLHYLCQCFADELCETKTVLPDYMDSLDPKDTEHLRYSVRVKDGSGFVFLNNFQDHFTLPARQNESITLTLPDGELVIKGIDLASGESAVLPFNQNIEDAKLLYATAQPITKMDGADGAVWFFMVPQGMTAGYHFAAETVSSISGCDHSEADGVLTCTPAAGDIGTFTMQTAAGEKVTIVTMSRRKAMDFYMIKDGGKEAAFLSDAPLLFDNGNLHIELNSETATVCAYPADALATFKPEGKDVAAVEPTTESIFTGFTVRLNPEAADDMPLTATQVGTGRYTLDIPQEALRGHKAVYLRANYFGDIGHAFINGIMLNDNFANGDTWETRLDLSAEKLAQYPLTIYITPIRENVQVDVSSPMAGQIERVGSVRAGLTSAALHPVNEISIGQL